jgi:hypothetical protein
MRRKTTLLRKLMMRKPAIAMAALAAVLALALTSVALAQAGNAHWYNQDSHEGKSSVQMQIANGVERIVAARVPTDIALDDIASLDFWKKITDDGEAAWDPLIVLALDLDDDGKYEAKEYRWQLEGVDDPELLGDDTFIQCEANVPGTEDANFVPVNVNTKFNCYAPDSSGVGYQFYTSLAEFQSGATETDTGISGDETVLAIKVHIGGSSNFIDEIALVDLVELNGDAILDEPNNSKASFQIVSNNN